MARRRRSVLYFPLATRRRALELARTFEQTIVPSPFRPVASSILLSSPPLSVCVPGALSFPLSLSLALPDSFALCLSLPSRDLFLSVAPLHGPTPGVWYLPPSLLPPSPLPLFLHLFLRHQPVPSLSLFLFVLSPRRHPRRQPPSRCRAPMTVAVRRTRVRGEAQAAQRKSEGERENEE